MPFPNADIGINKDPKEMGSKGGRASKGVPKFRKNRKCNHKCPIFDVCPYKGLSKLRYNGYCALVKMHPEEAKRIVRLFSKDKDAWYGEIVKLLVEAESNATDVNDQLKLLDRMIKFYDTLYNKSKNNYVIEYPSPSEILNMIEKSLEKQVQNSD